MLQWHKIKRPLFITGISALTGGAICLFLNLTFVLVCLGIVTALSLVFLFTSKKGIAFSLLLVLISSLASIILVSSIYRSNYEQLWRYNGNEYEIIGKIIDIPRSDGEKTFYTLEVTELDGVRLKYPFKAKFSSNSLHNGELYGTVKATATLFKPQNITASNFNGENYYISDEIALSIVENSILTPFEENPPAVLIKNDGQTDLRYYILSLRQKINIMLSEGVDSEASGILKGILLGDKSGISEEVNDSFIYSGISHLFCVSGLHLTFILSLFFILSEVLFLHRRLTLGIGIIVILLFMAITGFPKSVVRAGVMCILALTAELFNKEADPLNSLGASVIIILLINPLSAGDIGFLLSVFSTFGILTLFKPICSFFEKLFHIKDKFYAKDLPLPLKVINALGRNIIFAISVYLAVTVTTLPVIFVSFGYVSLISPLSNLIIIPLGELMLILGLIFIPLKMILPVKVFNITVAFAVEKLAKLIVLLAKSLASFKYAVFPISLKTFIIFLISVVLCVILFVFIKRYNKRCVAAVLLSLLFIFSVTLNHINSINRLKIYIWGTDSSSLVVVTKGGKSIILAYDGAYAYSAATSALISETAFTLEGYSNIRDEDDLKSISRITDRYMDFNNLSTEFVFDNDVFITRKSLYDGNFTELNYNGFSALFTFSMNSALSQEIKGEYDFIYADMDRYSVTDYILNSPSTKLLLYNDRYYNNQYLLQKCNVQIINSYSVDLSESNIITVFDNGSFNIKEWK